MVERTAELYFSHAQELLSEEDYQLNDETNALVLVQSRESVLTMLMMNIRIIVNLISDLLTKPESKPN